MGDEEHCLSKDMEVLGGWYCSRTKYTEKGAWRHSKQGIVCQNQIGRVLSDQGNDLQLDPTVYQRVVNTEVIGQIYYY